MMKKVFLAILMLPSILITSCNKESGGFVNPFPNDKYEKIGFRISENEKETITRALTTLETTTVENTVKNISSFDKYINRSFNEVQERSYMKAFAGEYSQGMDVKNVLNERKETKYRNEYKEEGEIEKTIYPRRLITESNSLGEEQYSYGSINKNEKITTYIHEEVMDETSGKEIPQSVSPIKIYKRTKSEKGSGQDKVIKVSEEDTGLSYEKDEKGKGGESFYLISQKDYIKEVDIHSGVNTDGDVVIVKEDKVLYPGEKAGYLKLKDQREYCALNNSISVAKLQLIEKPKNPLIWQTWENDWYLVKSVRKYTETVITSEVIEPNVPVSYLKNPIVISYTEEKLQFFVEDPKYDSNQLPKVDKEMQ